MKKQHRDMIQKEYRDSDGYWIDLKPGYRVPGDAHGIVEDTKRAAYDKLASVVACDCADCQAQPGYQTRTPARCEGCHRTEELAPTGRRRWQPIALDAAGICRACREADAEARA